MFRTCVWPPNIHGRYLILHWKSVWYFKTQGNLTLREEPALTKHLITIIYVRFLGFLCLVVDLYAGYFWQLGVRSYRLNGGRIVRVCLFWLFLIISHLLFLIILLLLICLIYFFESKFRIYSTGRFIFFHRSWRILQWVWIWGVSIVNIWQEDILLEFWRELLVWCLIFFSNLNYAICRLFDFVLFWCNV